MKRRPPSEPVGGAGLPAEIAAGPGAACWQHPYWGRAADLVSWGWAEGFARDEWQHAGRAWSIAAGLGEDGWRELLPAPVREATEIRRVL